MKQSKVTSSSDQTVTVFIYHHYGFKLSIGNNWLACTVKKCGRGTHTRTYAYTYTHHTCAHAHAHVCAHMCMHAHTHTHTHKTLPKQQHDVELL